MKKLSSGRAKALQFSPDTIQTLLNRDRGCFFCKMGIHMDKVPNGSRAILDPMHIVNKSQGGMGVIQNGLIGCRGHHFLMDNGGYDKEMRKMAEDYLKILYPGWTRESVTYSKWQGFAYRK